MPESRTRDRALAELLRLLPGVRQEAGDDELGALLSEELVKEVFKAAWDHQFDDDRTSTARLLRQVVREALEGLEE